MSIYTDAKALGIPIASHESDLYLKATPEARKLVAAYEHKQNVTTFNSSDGTGVWFDVPFAYDLFWEKRATPRANV